MEVNWLRKQSPDVVLLQVVSHEKSVLSCTVCHMRTHMLHGDSKLGLFLPLLIPVPALSGTS